MTLMKREENWHRYYQLLKEYVSEHHQLPGKQNKEKRKLLNWWKYNKRLYKQGKLTEEKTRLLLLLSSMRISTAGNGIFEPTLTAADD